MPTPTNPPAPGSGGGGSTPGTGSNPAPAGTGSSAPSTGGAPRTHTPVPPLPPSQRTLLGRMSNRVNNMSGHMIAISVIICLMFLLAVIMFTKGYQPPKTKYAYEFGRVMGTKSGDTGNATEKEQVPATPPSPSEVLERVTAPTGTNTSVINPPPQHQSKGVTGPISVLNVPSNGKGDMLVTNAIGAGGIAVISSGGSNTITVIGRDYNTGGGGFNGRQANSWPANTKPTRLEKILPKSEMTVGQTNDVIVEIKSGEDVLFELPRNWNVQTYPEQDAGRFSVAIDNHDVSSEDSSSLVNAQSVRFWNRSNRSFRFGIRCIKLKEDPFWRDK